MMTNERLETDKKSIDDTGIQRTEMQKENRYQQTQGKGMQDNQTENDTP